MDKGLAVAPLDNTDKKILNMIQGEFPLTERPFKDIGKRTGLTEEETLERVIRLKQRGYIRRIGPILEPKKLGYVSLLCAACVEGHVLDEVARAVSIEVGVTHNYEREGRLNLWFTVTMKNITDIDQFLKGLEKSFSIKIFRFFEKQRFKIRTRFILE